MKKRKAINQAKIQRILRQGQRTKLKTQMDSNKLEQRKVKQSRNGRNKMILKLYLKLGKEILTKGSNIKEEIISDKRNRLMIKHNLSQSRV